MIVPLDKPGTPEELVHFGVKGMRWGVRRSESSDSSGSTSNKGISTKKKVAIGVGVTAAVVGVAAAAYILRKHGNTRYIKMGNSLPSGESEAYKSLIRKGREEALRISKEAKRTSRPLPMNVEKRRKLLNVGTKVSSNVEKRREILGPLVKRNF